MDALKKFAGIHPQITSWVVLAIGMVIILVWSAWNVGFTPSQWTALIVTTILLAGAWVWIIGWEDEDDAPAQPEQGKVEVKVEPKEN
jgi:hypothetical protein